MQGVLEEATSLEVFSELRQLDIDEKKEHLPLLWLKAVVATEKRICHAHITSQQTMYFLYGHLVPNFLPQN